MNKIRIEQLMYFLKDEPNDPFTLYALATEYKTCDLKKTQEYFDFLLEKHEDYVPTYYHAAKLYAEMGEKEKAIHIYRKGIEKATAQGEHHALRELKSAYEEFMFDD